MTSMEKDGVGGIRSGSERDGPLVRLRGSSIASATNDRVRQTRRASRKPRKVHFSPTEV